MQPFNVQLKCFAFRTRQGILLMFLMLNPVIFAHAADSQSPQRINFGYSAIGSAATAPLWITQERGFFKKYALEIAPVYLAGGLAPVAVLSGEMEFAIMSAGVALPPALKGGDLVMIAAFGNYISHSLMVAPEITDPKQLKGKRIAIQRFGDLTHIASREAVKHLGLSESDVLFQQVGGIPTRFAALQSGNVQAAVLVPPFTIRARKAGYRVLLNLYDLKIPFVNQSVVTTRRLIASRRSTPFNLVKAVAEGIHFYKRQPEISLRILQRQIPGAAPDELSEAMEHFKRELDDRPYPRLEGIKTALELISQQTPAAKDADPARFVDRSLLEELERDGFFSALYGLSK